MVKPIEEKKSNNESENLIHLRGRLSQRRETHSGGAQDRTRESILHLEGRIGAPMTVLDNLKRLTFTSGRSFGELQRTKCRQTRSASKLTNPELGDTM